MTRRRGILYVTGVFFIIGPSALWFLGNVPLTPRPQAVAPAQEVALVSHEVGSPSLSALVQRDPMALVRLGLEKYDDQVREYRCVLVKQERLGKRLSELQEVELRFREDPYAVYMIWKTNADGARRALHMGGGDYVDRKGRKLARIEPNGAIARLFTKDIFLPLDSGQVRKQSRRSIAEAGFRSTFELLEAYNAVAEERGVLDLRYGGEGVVDERPTYIIVRDLPYEGPDGPYPDARMVLHVDQEWLLPVAVYSYADHDEKELLGSYTFTRIELNPNFDELAFKF